MRDPETQNGQHEPDAAGEEIPDMRATLAFVLAPACLVGALVLLTYGKTQGAILSFVLSCFALVSWLALFLRPPKQTGKTGDAEGKR